jgi:hypothetical protein
MESRFNIPAPAVVKRQSDAHAGDELAVDSASPARGRGGFGRTGFVEPSAEKSLWRVPRAARTANRHRWVSRIYSGA